MKWFTNIMVDLKWFKKKNYRDILMQNVDNTVSNLIIAVVSFPFDFFEVAFKISVRNLNISMHLIFCSS